MTKTDPELQKLLSTAVRDHEEARRIYDSACKRGGGLRQRWKSLVDFWKWSNVYVPIRKNIVVSLDDAGDLPESYVNRVHGELQWRCQMHRISDPIDVRISSEHKELRLLFKGVVAGMDGRREFWTAGDGMFEMRPTAVAS